jgi:hypothetical protein
LLSTITGLVQIVTVGLKRSQYRSRRLIKG